MAELKLEHIYKVYPNGTKAVNDFSMDIKNGEFIVFVGPSGCGKSTTLRMIAGLEDITAGELYIDGEIVNDREAKDRDIAMVFQNYALYPHMTVYDNMAFGLKLHHVPNDIIAEKVLWAADILGIKEYLDRKPRNMSGGQRQRVALGRAILRDPKVMLLDEPLSNLDAKLRAQMRTEIAKLHQKLKTTFIYVTHDQTEAMTLGDRVVVMKAGRIQQIDTPKNLYNYPGNKFVAGFIGTPQMNFINCTLKREKENVILHLDLNNQDLVISYNYLLKVLPQFLDGMHPLTLGVRCEHISLAKEASDHTVMAKISHFEELGSECLIYASIAKEEKVDSSEGQIIIKVDNVDGLEVGQEIPLNLDFNHVYFFDEKTENTIIPRIPEYNSFTVNIKDNKIQFLGENVMLPPVLATGDLVGAELKVPSDAFLFNEGMDCKVVSCEKIQDKILVQLLKGDRNFFALAEREYQEGEMIKVSLDFTKISLVFDGETLFAPIQERDEVNAAFLNFETVLAETNNHAFSEDKEKRIKEAEMRVDALLREENEHFEAEKASLQGRDLKAEYEKLSKEFEELVTANNEKIKKLKEDTKKVLSEKKSKYNLERKEATEENNKLFEEKKIKEKEDYKEFCKTNKDKASLKRRSDEYHIFFDNFNSDKENTLNLALNELSMDYESQVSSLKAAEKRQINLWKKEISEKKKALAEQKDPLATLTKKHEDAVKELEKRREEEGKKAGFLFFFQIEGSHFSLSSDVISNKLIQGLGTRVFTKNFRIAFPHDAYQLSDKGFEAVVDGNLDYGNTFYVRLRFDSKEGDVKYLFLKSDKAYDLGTKLHIEFDLTRSQITETDMNIRLY